MWVQSNWWTAPYPNPEDNYNFNLRRLRVTPYRPQTAVDKPGPTDNLARSGADVTTIRSAATCNWKYLSDGDRTSERGQSSTTPTNRSTSGVTRSPGTTG